MEKKETENKLYFVTSIYLNSYLLSKGFELVKTAKLDSGKVAIYYKDTNELHQAIAKYRDNMEIKDFVTELRNVQQIVRMHK